MAVMIKTIVPVLIFLVLLWGTPFNDTTNVEAATITLSAWDLGWYRDTGHHFSETLSYTAGQFYSYPSLQEQEYRNFFVFDLGEVGEPIINADLRLYNPPSGYIGDITETYQLYDVSTPVPDLVAGGSGLIDIYNDIGTGTSYGSRVVSSADNGTMVTITLNPDGIIALNSQLGADFAIGGAIMTISGLDNQYVFGNTHENGIAELVLETIPEPATLLLFALGAAMLKKRR